MDLKLVGLIFAKLVPVTILILGLCTCYFCHPVAVLYTTTPRIYNDRFLLNRHYRPINASNTSFNDSNQLEFSSGLLIDPQNKLEFENSRSLAKVKAVNLGEKTMKQSNDDDDDDDDGGEYSGLDGSCGNTGVKQKDSVPMMIIRELDMMALEIPVKSKDKNDKRKDLKISPNSNSKVEMKSFQSRWKPAHENQHVEKNVWPSNSQNIISDNNFRIQDKKMEYELDDQGEDNIGFGSISEKRGVGLLYDADRRDLDYILDSKRGQSYRSWNHQPAIGRTHVLF